MSDPVVEAAREAFKQRLVDSSDVSAHTRNAQAIAKDWKRRVHELDSNRFHFEVSISPDLDQRIDILDKTHQCAYEFKVSGKNASSEFYKDIIKVIVWNEKNKEKIRRLLFITEESWGRKYLDTPMPKTFIDYLRRQGLDISIVYLKL